MTLDWWYLVITISMISAAYTQAFLMPLPVLELNPGQGLRWMLRGAKLLCALVSTDRVSRAQFLCIECAQLSGKKHPPECRSCRMQISPLTSFSVPLQDSIQTCEILGLMEGGSCVPLMPPVGIQGIGV